jgi:hypothetical protein
VVGTGRATVKDGGDNVNVRRRAWAGYWRRRVCSLQAFTAWRAGEVNGEVEASKETAGGC